jgi:hypothetical protein
MTSPFKVMIHLDGELTSAQAKKKWEDTAVSEARKAKIKGRATYRHSVSKGKYILYYYHNYGGDFCDTMFTGEIYEYDEGKCQITGKVTASKGLKRFSAVLIALSAPLALLFTMLVYHVAPHLPYNETMRILTEGFEHNIAFIFGGTVTAFIAIAILCLWVDNRRVKSIMDYLSVFLKEETA